MQSALPTTARIARVYCVGVVGGLDELCGDAA